MFRQSPSRNQRSKGFKVKHALQIFLLLAVSVWLLYQIKHSHDKKKAFDESNAELTEKYENAHEIIKLGRKDPHPRVEETTTENEKHGAEEENDDEDNRHEEDIEEDESKPEEGEEEGRGGGDDEIDEQDQEREDEEADRREDFIDEDDKENEEKENQKEDVDSSDDQDHDRNTQEAREENYKGDDASSAVARDTQATNAEAGNADSINPDEEKQVDHTEGVTTSQNDSTPNATEVSNNIEGNSSANATTSEEIPERKPSLAGNESQLNSSLSTPSDNQSEATNNSTAEIAQAPPLPLLNGTDMNSYHDQKPEVGTSNEGNSNGQTVVPEKPDNNTTATGVEQSMLSNTTDNADASNSEERPVTSNATSGEEGQSGSSTENENENGGQSEKSEANIGTGEADASTNLSTIGENEGEALNIPIDAGDSTTILEEEREFRTDLGTLPETQSEGTNGEDAAEE